MDVTPGKPRLYWFGNIVEIDLISIATHRGVRFEALRSPNEWLGRALKQESDFRTLLFWRNLSKPPEIAEMPESAAPSEFLGQLFATLGDQDDSVTMIDLSQRTRALEAILTDRLKRRTANNLFAYPTLRERLTEYQQSHVVHREIAEQIIPFA